MSRFGWDISKPRRREPMWPGLMRVAGLAGLILIGLLMWSAKADTLVQMPPARWHGCKPKGPVEIRRHVGTVDCGGVQAPSCARRRGKAWIIDLQIAEACVTEKMRVHEWAHTCGWRHQGMRMERCP